MENRQDIDLHTEADSSPVAAAPNLHDEQRSLALGRTPGLKIFDATLYPFLNSIGVTGISIFFTYLTRRGGHFGKEGSTMRQFGELVQKRGDWSQKKFESFGMSAGAANTAMTVLWSFLDGCILVPGVKLMEDRREEIARAIDKTLGTTPEDTSVYAKEPRQSWSSIILGRALTAGIVVPTAIALEKNKIGGLNLNEQLFYKPGEHFGNWLCKHPDLVKKFGKENIQEVAKVTFFEAFYSSVCSIGLYFTSRKIARWTDKDTKDAPQPATTAANKVPLPTNDNQLHSMRLGALMQLNQDHPDARIHSASRQDRLIERDSASLTAGG